MNRGDAYIVLSRELDTRRELGYHALVTEVGQPARQRLVRIGDEDVVVETSVQWADAKKHAIRISASAAGPNWWKLERLDESILVYPAD